MNIPTSLISASFKALLPSGRGRWGSWLLLSLLLVSCARMGSPDGGWYDDTPPRVISSSPADGAADVTTRRVTINFDEYIKIEDAQNKVIVSPPQIEMADIKASGRRIIVDLKDSLKANTTYTIDFSDAITDNNEGNPMGNFTFSFSTGSHIDTLEVAGYCLNAENLEPIKGMLVGLYPADSLYLQPAAGDSLGSPQSPVLNPQYFHRSPFMRVSRTNGSGRFSIKGVAPGAYVAYALQDADGDFLFSQKSEMVGYSHQRFVPSWKPDTRQDTIWRDSLHIADIVRVPYTHFLPDDITLLCFQEPQTDRFLLKTERQSPEKFTVYFTYGSDSLPDLRGLDFSSDDAFVVEASERLDTITYWLRDTTLVNRDTLTFALTYQTTDSLGQLVAQTDTIEALAKISYEKRMKELQKEREKWEKEQERHRKRGESYDSVMPVKPLVPKLSAGGQIDPLERVYFEMPEPLMRCDTAAVHLYSMIDSVWYASPHELRQLSTRLYELQADWRVGTEYSLEIDSAAFAGLYGQVSAPMKQGIKVRTADEFSSFVVGIVPNPVQGDSVARIVVQLLDSSDKPVRQVVADDKGVARFPYLKPATYYMRAFVDLNGNGLWDTGCYDADRQAEPVYYHSEALECKAKWDVSRQWNMEGTPRYRQKPASITKQKPDKEKQLKNRNIERARQLGKEYLKENRIPQ